jgi:MFS family permease
VSEVKTAVQRISDAGKTLASEAGAKLLAAGSAATAPTADATTPHYGLIAMGIVMAGLGVMLFTFTGFSSQNVFFWIGLGFTLGGGGCLAGAWNEETRLPKSVRPNPGGLIMGAVMLLLGSLILGFLAASHRMFPEDVLIWIGIGMTLGGGGCICGAWNQVLEQQKQRKAQQHADNMKPTDFDAVCNRLRAPAIGLTIAAAFELWPILLIAFAFVKPYVAADLDSNPNWSMILWGSVGTFIGLAVAITFVIAAVGLTKARMKGWITFAAILGLIPFHPGCLLTLPVSIWVLKVLNDKDVTAAFTYAKSYP